MRPRPEGRGEQSSELATDFGTACFNAATTRRPWRTPRGRDEAARSGCFNAATTRRPWRTDDFRRRGGRLDAGFNAATTRRPWRTWFKTRPGGGKIELQCGHDPKAVENASRIILARGTAGFNAATTRRPWRTRSACKPASHVTRASMRPRPEGRGERRRNAVVQRARTRLQCGHDPKAVENGCLRQNHAVWGRASMRPRPEGRGELPSTSCRQVVAQRFNAATTRRPWRTDYTAGSGRYSLRFNAATTRRPWRTPASRSRQKAQRLQCGHDPKAVENLRP